MGSGGVGVDGVGEQVVGEQVMVGGGRLRWWTRWVGGRRRRRSGGQGVQDLLAVLG